MSLIPYIQSGERVVAENSPLYADVDNRVMKFVTLTSGLDDTQDFRGFASGAVGNGSPEGVVSHRVGAIYGDRTGASGVVWVKTAGVGNIGWKLLPTIASGSGTVNTLVKFGALGTLVDSHVTDDGSLVTITGPALATTNFTANTSVISPLFGTITAVDPVFRRNSVTQLTLGSLAATFAGTAAATAFIVGTNPATVGGIRLPNGNASGIIARNAANGADYTLLYFSNLNETQLVGGPAGLILAGAFGSSTITVTTGGETFIDGAFTKHGNNGFIQMGSAAVATTGVLRLRNNVAINWRNVADSINITGMQLDASNILQIGLNATSINLNSAATFTSSVTISDGFLLSTRNVNESGPLPTGSTTATFRNMDATAVTLHQVLLKSAFASTDAVERIGPTIVYYKEQEWTSTAATRDAGISWYNVVNGVHVRFMNVASTLITTFDGAVTMSSTLAVTTSITSPLFGTTTAANVIIQRNSVTQLTLASLLATFAGDLTVTTDLINNGTTASLVQSATSATLNVGTGAGSGTSQMSIRGAAGQTRQMGFRTGTNLRITFALSTTAEAGANVGSDMTISAFDDAGAGLGAIIGFNRANRNIALFAGPTSTFGGGVLTMFIANATTSPTTNPTGGGLVYAEGGALKYRGSAGTVTTLARHNMATTIAGDLNAGTVQTTNATPATLQTIAIPTGGVVVFDGYVASRIGAITSGAGYTYQAAYKNNGGTVTLIGAALTPLVAEDAGLAAASIALVISGTNVIVQVTGIVATTIEWAGWTLIVKNV